MKGAYCNDFDHTPSKYTAEEGSKCEFCDAPAVHRIRETNTCDNSRCKYMAWTEDHEDHG